MSISVKNGGIGKSPAISRINRLSPEKEVKEITEKMRRAIESTETRALPIKNKVRPELYNLWDPATSVELQSCYPAVKLNVNSLSAHITSLVGAVSDCKRT